MSLQLLWKPHQLLAKTWKPLEKRLDIESLVGEIIGDHSVKLTSTTNAGSQHLRALSFNLFVALRIIFDLQRTYLQSSEPDSRTRAYVLEHDQLCLVIQYLIHVQSQPYWRVKSNEQEHNAQLDFLAQTFVSGLRALWLHPQQPSPHQVSNLSKSFNTAWDGLTVEVGTNFLVYDLCPRIIKELDVRPKTRLSEPVCEVFRLPDYELGLVG